MSCNVAKEYIDFAKTCIIDYLKTIMGKRYDEELAQEFCTVYLNVRYYNLLPYIYNKLEANINYYMKEKGLALTKDHDEDLVKDVFYCFNYILYLDNVRWSSNLEENLEDLTGNRSDTLKRTKNSVSTSQLITMADRNHKKELHFLKSFETNDFELIFMKTSRDDLFRVDLHHHLTFPKLYSDIAIQNVFDSDTIAEQKLFVEYHLLAADVLRQMIIGNLYNNYLVEFNIAMTEKKSKTSRLLKIIDSDLIKDKVSLMVKYEDFCNYKDYLCGLIKKGYKLAVLIDDSYKYTFADEKMLDVFSYIIVSKKDANRIPTSNRIVII